MLWGRVNGQQEGTSILKYLSGVSIKVLLDYLHKFWGQNFYKEGRNVIPVISFKGKFVTSNVVRKLRVDFIIFENIFVVD